IDRLLSAGLRVAYLPEARGFHYHVKGFDAYKRDMFSSGVTMVAIVRKHPEVRSRVNLELVEGKASTLGPRKRLERAVFRTLERLPFLVRALEAAISALEPLGL